MFALLLLAEFVDCADAPGSFAPITTVLPLLCVDGCAASFSFTIIVASESSSVLSSGIKFTFRMELFFFLHIFGLRILFLENILWVSFNSRRYSVTSAINTSASRNISSVVEEIDCDENSSASICKQTEKWEVKRKYKLVSMNSYDSLTFMFAQNLTWNKEKKRMCGYVCFLFIRSQKNILTMAIKLIPSISMYVLGQMSNSCFWFLEKPFFINAPSINIRIKNIRRSNMLSIFFNVTSIER